jgi:uncharacterized membrane protein
MTWHGSTDGKDRLFGALIYLLPLFDTYQLGDFVYSLFPLLGVVLGYLTSPIGFIYASMGGFGSLIVFFVLYLAVVRNTRISHFIRFNAMQALLIDILLYLCTILLGIIGNVGANLILQTLVNVVFIGGLAACSYAIFQSLLGKYADIPTISDAAYSQVGG